MKPNHLLPHRPYPSPATTAPSSAADASLPNHQDLQDEHLHECGENPKENLQLRLRETVSARTLQLVANLRNLQVVALGVQLSNFVELTENVPSLPSGRQSRKPANSPPCCDHHQSTGANTQNMREHAFRPHLALSPLTTTLSSIPAHRVSHRPILGTWSRSRCNCQHAPSEP